MRGRPCPGYTFQPPYNNSAMCMRCGEDVLLHGLGPHNSAMCMRCGEDVDQEQDERMRADAAHKVCQALLGLRSPASLSAALGTDLPEGVADVLLALTAWMDATGQVDMSKRTITFVAKGEKYSLMTEGDLERMRGETFSIVVDNLRAQAASPSAPMAGVDYDTFTAGLHYAADLIETVGSYYLVKYRDALAEAGALDPAPESIEPLPPTDPSPSMG